jgi:MFS family permease
MGDSPRLRRIVVAYTVNQLGTWFGLVALSVGVLEHTHSDLAVAAVLAVPFLPALLAPAVVARMEKSSRRGGLSLLYAIEAASTAGLAVLLWQFSLPGILILVAIDGGVAYAARALLRSEAAYSEAPADPADGRDGDAPASERAAHRANAALNISLALSAVVGPALAGPAVGGLGGPVALLIDAGCFVVTALLLLDVRPYVEDVAASLRARLREVRAHLRAAPRLRALLLIEAVALVFFTSAFPVEVQYVKSTLRAGDVGYGALLAVWGVGMIGGSLLFARVDGRLWTMLIGGTFAVAFSYLAFGVAPTLGVAFIPALLGGFGNGVQWASLIGLVQSLTPRRLMGRMMGVVETMSSAAPVVGFSIGGVLAALTTPRVALLGAGAGALASALAFLRIAAAQAPSVPETRLELVGTGKAAKTD